MIDVTHKYVSVFWANTDIFHSITYLTQPIYCQNEKSPFTPMYKKYKMNNQ